MKLDDEDIEEVVCKSQPTPNYLELYVTTTRGNKYMVHCKTAAVVAFGEMYVEGQDDGGKTNRMDLAIIFSRAQIDLARYPEGEKIPLPGIDDIFEWTNKYLIGKWPNANDCPFVYPWEGMLEGGIWDEPNPKRTKEYLAAVPEMERRWKKALSEI